MGVPYFDHNNFQLILGDTLEILEQIEEESVDVIFADPPYNLSNGGFTCKSGRRASVHKGEWDQSRGIELDFSFHEKWIKKCRRVLKENGTIWISGTYHSIYACGFALQKNEYHILNDICWYKPNAAPNLSTRYFTASHETIIWARKYEKSKHYYNYNLMKNEDWSVDILKKPHKQMRSVWSIPTPSPSEKKQGKHPTQKPVELLKRIIMASTKEGDVVLDPFTGSSTTGLVAHSLGRKFIGIDNSVEFLDLSVKRYKNIQEIHKKLLLKNIKPIEKYSLGSD